MISSSKEFCLLVKPHVEYEHGVLLPTTNKNVKQKTWLICRHICKAGYFLCANTQDVLLGSNCSIKLHKAMWWHSHSSAVWMHSQAHM